jgi:hypothetical protein
MPATFDGAVAGDVLSPVRCPVSSSISSLLRALADQQRKTRPDLGTQRTAEAKKLAELQVGVAPKRRPPYRHVGLPSQVLG